MPYFEIMPDPIDVSQDIGLKQESLQVKFSNDTLDT